MLLVVDGRLCAASFSDFFFFFNDTATTEIYTLSLHDALPLSPGDRGDRRSQLCQPLLAVHHRGPWHTREPALWDAGREPAHTQRSCGHTGKFPVARLDGHPSRSADSLLAMGHAHPAGNP